MAWWHRLMPDSIVARTTLSILALSLMLGLLFATGASLRTQRTEEKRLQVQLQELLSTVESTARVACYLSDDTLAKEISQGLVSNHAVSGVRIVANNRELYATSNVATISHHGDGIEEISRKIYSPFEADTVVGEITLYTSSAYIHEQARRYSAATALILGLQVTFVAAGVALVVYFFVTRPIRGISNELHHLEVTTGMHLHVPYTNHSDEIGRLVSDVNLLIANLTSLLATERELRIEHEMQERRMKLIFDKAETALFVFDVHGNVQSWNPAFTQMLKVAEPEPDKSLPRLHELLASHGMQLDALISQALQSGEACNLDVELPAHDAVRSQWLELSINPIGPAQLQGVINDVTERKHSELAAHRAATHDALTGLLNRVGMTHQLAELFNRSDSQRALHSALLQIDLDYFKQVNDTYGHEAGDIVLRHVARAMENATRRSDLIARHGGDEFIVALIGIEQPEKALQIAQNLIAKISEPVDIGSGHLARVSASIGIAFPTSSDETPEAILRRADAAMYEAKQSGRSRACLAAQPIANSLGANHTASRAVS